jgi:adenylate cyclase
VEGPPFAVNQIQKGFLDPRRHKGPYRSVEIYELLGEFGPSSAKAEIARTYERALDAYFGRNFEAAIELLERQRADKPSELLFCRCQQLLQAPPPPDWNGVHPSTTK